MAALVVETLSDILNSLNAMNSPAAEVKSPKNAARRSPLKAMGVGALRMILAGILLGWLYAWASPQAYPKDRPLGFMHGMVHGGLMPMALPALVIGHDVEIFAANNNGRLYKLGYICGINICGLLFFGFSFGGLRARR